LRGSGREYVTEKLGEDAKNEHKPLRKLFTAG